MRRSTGKSDEPPYRAQPQGTRILVLGMSWGGLHAARAIIPALPPDFRIPVALVQHRHRDSDALLARFLQGFTSLPVCEVEDKQPIEPGRVFIAPANYHTLVEEGHFSLSTEAPVRFSRPSIDVAFTSAADAYGRGAAGVVLTGANDDGAEGLRRIADAGGLAIVQDPATSEAPSMPMAALRAVPDARVLPLDELGAYLSALADAVPAAGSR